MSYGPPTPLRLDDVAFAVIQHERESAWRGSILLGELDLADDATNTWRSRRCIAGEMGDWRPMRSRAEARAYLASRVVMPFWREAA